MTNNFGQTFNLVSLTYMCFNRLTNSYFFVNGYDLLVSFTSLICLLKFEGGRTKIMLGIRNISYVQCYVYV